MNDAPTEGTSLSATALFGEAGRRLRATASALAALLLAGVVVAGVDWAMLNGPVPTVGRRAVQDGTVSVSFGVVVRILSRTSVPLSSFLDLKLSWVAWTAGLNVAAFVTVTGASAYALVRLLDVPLRASATLRYAAVAAALGFDFGRADFEGGSVLLALPLLVAVFVLFVRLFALPGLLIAGHPILPALRRSWALADGRGWTLFGVVVLLGLANHLLGSVPLVGPMGSALVGALHAGTVAAFLRSSGVSDDITELESP